jgi:hypothetical protein
LVTRSSGSMERFRYIKGFEEYYAVSNIGRVLSTKKTYPKEIRSWTTNSGYLQVNLSKNGKRYHKNIHNLVAEAFIPKAKGENCVNHKNFDKSDNRVENLEWCTHKENTKHAVLNGRVGNTPLKVRCKNGHLYTPENTYYYPNSTTKYKLGYKRECRTCSQVYKRNYEIKRRMFI